MKKYIVDFFPYFDKTGRELLELRIHMLDKYVDKFVICESNKTHSGIPLEYNLAEVIKQLKLPSHKIKIIQQNIPDTDKVSVEPIDIFNCYDDNKNRISILARARERMQKDSILTALNEFDENTVFFISDSDEIINPNYIDWVTNVALSNQEAIIKIPLVHLEGRADLRVYKGDIPKLWDGGMFVCTKRQLEQASPTQIRSNVFNPFGINYLYIDGKRVEDMGWHFSWMGNAETRATKRVSFTHHNDSFNYIKGQKYNGSDMIKLHYTDPEEGMISPSGEVDTVLKLYPLNKLPKELFELNTVKNYLLPETGTKDIFEQEYLRARNTETDINQHLEILKNLADECTSVTEMGTRDGQSTRAFLVTNTKLTAYDLELDPIVVELFSKAKQVGKSADYIQADVLQLDIEPTDLLFIDTWHTYTQLRQELAIHGNKAKKYLAFHDTQTYGTTGEASTDLGLLPAIIEFMILNPHWRFKIHRTVNNGLTVLERTDNA